VREEREHGPGRERRPPIQLDGKTVSIIGLAESGEAAARLALDRKGDVYVSDLRTDAEARARGDELGSMGADVDLGGHDLARLALSDTVVVSPGIPPDAAVLVALRERGVRWVSEPEFAFRFLDGSLIAVTGTNGKTTTAVLTAHLLREGGRDVALGGNVGGAFGPPVSELARRPAVAWYVVEMSSFQLADIVTFRPDIGIVTNIAPDHLDRYDSVESYYADKARLFLNADPDSIWVLPAGDAGVDALVGDAPGRRYTFGATSPSANATLLDGQLTLTPYGAVEPLLTPGELPLLGSHNVENALAASLAARVAGVEAADIARALTAVPVLPHRMERVAELGGALWVNDSKATNVAASKAAIESLPGPLVVLLGGKDKGEPFGPLAESLVGKAAKILAFGEAGRRIADEIGSDVRVQLCDVLEDALDSAFDASRAGDTVVLSPACSSFDAFESYEARGDAFRSWVLHRTEVDG
jgi:UDP-N-acetylmuramoylalanine--D-glutamate ligase